MFNRDQCGLHHPGNTIPCCVQCNKRGRNKDNSYMNWEEHLHQICLERGEVDRYERRKEKITKHSAVGKYKHPDLTEEEKDSISVIANRLYENIKLEHLKSLNLYKDFKKLS